MQTLTLPKSAQRVIENYLNINFSGTSTACPYHINHSLFSRKLSMLGKGSPKEIEQEVDRAFTNLGFSPKSSEQLRAYMRACGIGIDCSGLVSHILDSISLDKTGRHLKNNFKVSGAKSRLAKLLRQNGALSASNLTSSKNCNPVGSLADARPGDLIRIPNGRHVILLHRVSLNNSGQAVELGYVQSSCNFLEESGVVTGRAKVAMGKRLHELNWIDKAKLSNVTKDILSKHQDSTVVRPKFLL